MNVLTFNELLKFIPTNRNETISARTLAQLTHLQESTIRRKINEARKGGIPICSTQSGYYVSYECADIAKTIRFLTNRLNTQLQAIRGLQNALQDVTVIERRTDDEKDTDTL